MSNNVATPEQRRAMRDVIICQCFGVIPLMAYGTGLMLLYLTSLRIPANRILVYVALPLVCGLLFKLPFAYLSDRFGKKRVGTAGALMELGGCAVIAASGYVDGVAAEVWVVSGIFLFGIGHAAVYSSWMALLDPIVPESMRGRYFGRLRMAWQGVILVFACGCAVFLSASSPRADFVAVLWLLVAGMIVRLVFYHRIPEMEAKDTVSRDFIAIARRVCGRREYMGFCTYVFILALFGGAQLSLFGLVEKEVLGFGDDRVMWLGNLFMAGSMIGFVVAGWAVDHWGTKRVFILAHCGTIAVVPIFLGRGMGGGDGLWAIGLANLGAGMMYGMSSIAVTAEMLALIPGTDKSVATSICQIAHFGGRGLSGVLGSALLSLGVVAPAWRVAGYSFSGYEAVLAIFAGILMLMSATLVLVPSVRGRAGAPVHA